MTTVQLDTMHTQLWQNIGAIADNESLMKRLARYVAKLAKEKEDETLMTREEFMVRVDRAEKHIAEGKGTTFHNLDDMHAWLSTL